MQRTVHPNGTMTIACWIALLAERNSSLNTIRKMLGSAKTVLSKRQELSPPAELDNIRLSIKYAKILLHSSIQRQQQLLFDILTIRCASVMMNCLPVSLTVTRNMHFQPAFADRPVFSSTKTCRTFNDRYRYARITLAEGKQCKLVMFGEIHILRLGGMIWFNTVYACEPQSKVLRSWATL